MAKNPANPWSVRDLFPAHFTLTDVSGGRFTYAEPLSREGPGLAGAAQNQMDIWVLNWSAMNGGEHDPDIKAKDQATVEAASRKAKTWCWVSFGVGVLAYLLLIVFGVIGEPASRYGQ